MGDPRRSTPLLDGEFLSPHADCPSRKVTFCQAVWSLVATIVGGGVLSLSFTVMKCGLLVGMLSVLASAVLNILSLDLLIACARRTGVNSYEEIAEKAYGSSARLVTVLVSITLLWLVVVAYILTVCDILSPVVRVWMGSGGASVISTNALEAITKTAVVVLIGPACFQRSLSGLRCVSVLSFCSACVMAVAILIRVLPVLGKAHTAYIWDAKHGGATAVTVGAEFGGINLVPTGVSAYLYALPALVMSLMCHPNTLPLHSELKRPTRKRVRMIIRTVVAVCSVLYIVVGCAAYIWSGPFTCANLVLNFDPGDPVMMVGRLGLGIACTCNISLLVLPLRTSIHKLLGLVADARAGQWISCRGTDPQDWGPSPPPSPSLLPSSNPWGSGETEEGDHGGEGQEGGREAETQATFRLEMPGGQSFAHTAEEAQLERQRSKSGMEPCGHVESQRTSRRPSPIDTGTRQGSFLPPDSAVGGAGSVGVTQDEKGGASGRTSIFSAAVANSLHAAAAVAVAQATNTSAVRASAVAAGGAEPDEGGGSRNPQGQGAQVLGVTARSGAQSRRAQPIFEAATGFDADLPDGGEMSCQLLVVVTFLCLASTLSVALLLNSIMSVWSLAGSACALAIAFTLPALFFLKVRRNRPFGPRKAAVWVMLAGSLVVTVLSLVQSVEHMGDPTCPVFTQFIPVSV